MRWSVVERRRTGPWTVLALVVAAICLAIALAACGSGRGGAARAELPGEPDATLADVDGRTFLSASVDGHDLVADTVIALTFTADSISANAGCNTMSGSYTLDDGTLTVAPNMAQTAMACDADLMAQDTWLAGFLIAGADATFTNDVLTLDHDGTKIVLGDSEMKAL
jgi:heat shock protein HslJ